ncbi:MAG: peptidoglycan-binding domain-containing protein [Candidatus Omnitrophota bacterium]
MHKNITIGIVFIMLLTGCVTTQRGQGIQTQELQTRVNYLELELKRKNQEINRLESELEKTQYVTLSPNDQKIEYKESEAPKEIPMKQVQIALKKAGFYKGDIDGKQGPKTKEAIRAFQKARGLKVDGVVGKTTWQVLNKYSN